MKILYVITALIIAGFANSLSMASSNTPCLNAGNPDLCYDGKSGLDVIFLSQAETKKTDGKKTLTFKNGDEYFGELKNGKPNGKGIIIYHNGGKYLGEFKQGKPHGKGIFTDTDGNKYFGGFKDGKKHGNGTEK